MYNIGMKNVRRAIEQQIIKATELFPVVVLTGLRRAGKTFLLKSLFPKYTYVQLKTPDLLLAVKEDPRGFLDNLALPVVIDEIQEIPELFSYIRSHIDEHPEKNGQWILTGSQESLLMEGVTESMAGRAAIMRLAPFSHFEYDKVTAFTGGYPETFAARMDREIWYSSYIQSDLHLGHTTRSFKLVRNLATFHRFLKVLATRHGQMLNKTAIAAPLGVSVPTLTEWINVLEISGIVKLVPPYYRNAGKRLVKTPKLYFLDSGLVCHLLGIQSQKA